MIDLIKADFYKLFRSKGFYICTVLSIAFVLITLYSANNSYKAALEAGAVSVDYSTGYSENAYNNGEYVVIKPNVVGMLGKSFDSIYIIFILIAISLFTASDFSCGAIKNIVLKSPKREYIFFSKFITAIFITLVILVANLLTFTITSIALWGVGELPQNFYPELLRMCGLELLAFIAITSIVTTISFLSEKPGKVISVNFCILFLSDIVLGFIFPIINKIFKSDLSTDKYWIFGYPDVLANYNLESDIIVRCSIVSIIFIAIMTLLGVLIIRRKEIK